LFANLDSPFIAAAARGAENKKAWMAMDVLATDESHNRNFPPQDTPDRAVRQLAERFALTIPVATTIAALAGLGERDVEARS
jgi:hypothetical protein